MYKINFHENDFLNWNNQDYCYYYENTFSISLFGDRKKK